MIALAIAGCALALYALHRLALYAEKRGWIYYLHRKASPGTRAGAFLEMQSLIEPDRKHVITAQKQHEAEDESGDPPKP